MNMRRKAFSLVELLVVMAVLAVLISIMLPSLQTARGQARSMLCLTKLRELGTAAFMYAGNNNEYYPLAYDMKFSGSTFTSCVWDFTTVKDWHTLEVTVTPGLLWEGDTIAEVQQCPAYDGEDNWLGDPYTGYNYNTSYIGHGTGEAIATPAKTSDVQRPADCALFGDGEYAGGANKFMRAPWPNDADAGFIGRAAGTQGYRHLGSTNVAWCDGSSRAVRACYKETDVMEVGNIAEGTGFLSASNSAYDLR